MKDQGPRSLGVLPIIGSLMVLALLIVVALQIYTGEKNQDIQTITKPIERASILQCRTQIRNLRTTIEMYSVQYGKYPADLRTLENIDESMRYCPVTRNAYSYDPETGKVTCPDHP